MNKLDRPTIEEVTQTILRTGECFSADLERIRYTVNIFAPVFAKFVITTTPPGFAPEQIRKQWVGLELPLRATSPQGKPVWAAEAIEALDKAEHAEAAQWWRNSYANDFAIRGVEKDPEFPEMAANLSFLVFNPHCGEVSTLGVRGLEL